jgi:hypothetical protein
MACVAKVNVGNRFRMGENRSDTDGDLPLSLISLPLSQPSEQFRCFAPLVILFPPSLASLTGAFAYPVFYRGGCVG